MKKAITDWSVEQFSRLISSASKKNVSKVSIHTSIRSSSGAYRVFACIVSNDSPRDLRTTENYYKTIYFPNVEKSEIRYFRSMQVHVTASVIIVSLHVSQLSRRAKSAKIDEPALYFGPSLLITKDTGLERKSGLVQTRGLVRFSF